MKRFLFYILSLLFCTGVFAEDASDNILAYLPLMPDAVKYYEQQNKIDEVYIGFVIYEGVFYHSILDEKKAIKTYNKAKRLIKQYPDIAKKVPAELIEQLYEISNSIENLETSVDEEPIAKYFKSGEYKNILPCVKSYLDQLKEYFTSTYLSVSEQDRYNMSEYVDKNIDWHYILSSVYYTNDFSANGEIYDYILFAKQLQLRTSKQIKEAIKSSNDKELLDNYEEYQRIEKLLAMSNPPSTLNRDSLQERMNSLGRLLSLSSKGLFKNEEISWRQIQKRLAYGQVAVEFFEFHLMKGMDIADANVYAALIITQSCETPIFKVLNTKANLNYFDVENQSDLYDINKYGAAMAQLFWRDLLFYFSDNDISTIFFSPFGIINTLAIESLPYSSETPIMHHYKLYRLSSTRDLASKHTFNFSDTAVLYGNLSYRLSYETMENNQIITRDAIGPLPGTKKEIENIQTILQGYNFNIKSYSREKGTEESVSEIGSPSILHFATHGFVKESDDESIMSKTGLVFSYGARALEGRNIPKGAEDGILTSAEIETLDLSNTDIVVLSACNTALGEVTTEGVWGLQRAFKKAGVKTVVMSLWQVDDEATAVFMEYFYKNLLSLRENYRSSDDKLNLADDYFVHQALQSAQYLMSRDPKYSDPYYWAAFIAIN